MDVMATTADTQKQNKAPLGAGQIVVKLEGVLCVFLLQGKNTDFVGWIRFKHHQIFLSSS